MAVEALSRVAKRSLHQYKHWCVAALAYMSQNIVAQFSWLSAGEMMDGLGLAGTTPGPLILVTEFVAFVAAYRDGGILLGVLGALVALWVTFAPCFLWILQARPISNG